MVPETMVLVHKWISLFLDKSQYLQHEVVEEAYLHQMLQEECRRVLIWKMKSTINYQKSFLKAYYRAIDSKRVQLLLCTYSFKWWRRWWYWTLSLFLWYFNEHVWKRASWSRWSGSAWSSTSLQFETYWVMKEVHSKTSSVLHFTFIPDLEALV